MPSLPAVLTTQLKDALKADIFGATFTDSQNSPLEMSNSTSRFPSQTPAAPKSHCHRQEQPLLPLVAYFSHSTPTQEPQPHTRSSRKPPASFGCCSQGVSRRQTQISLKPNKSCSNTFPIPTPGCNQDSGGSGDPSQVSSSPKWF